MEEEHPLTMDEATRIGELMGKWLGELIKKLPEPKQGPTFAFRKGKFIKLKEEDEKR